MLVPRFVTYDVAMIYTGESGRGRDDIRGYEVLSPIDDLRSGESFDAVASALAFKFLGFGAIFLLSDLHPVSFVGR
jgi:hypothetical protein